ncbi:hypothetical protein PGT21_006948 [Puccinia graminis f. sp. tritici]|uniref:Uncharacterized protein n=1 Tax=Puccinia graminis f. sp. tritici TaxID=56615 RepID=A0A5B0MTB1_PUCGR|nr:hypothetical protein PGT21_006948 [Puccinia graminis f. sp. tritici]KAA1082257.1 hypothetical protein PGTUg99_030130 [Puccinia graminis f. sp. tritici]
MDRTITNGSTLVTTRHTYPATSKNVNFSDHISPTGAILRHQVEWNMSRAVCGRAPVNGSPTGGPAVIPLIFSRSESRLDSSTFKSWPAHFAWGLNSIGQHFKPRFPSKQSSCPIDNTNPRITYCQTTFSLD